MFNGLLPLFLNFFFFFVLLAKREFFANLMQHLSDFFLLRNGTKWTTVVMEPEERDISLRLVISISKPYISVRLMDWEMSRIILWISHVSSMLSVCNRLLNERGVAAFRFSSDCHHDVLKTWICKQVSWFFFFLETYIRLLIFSLSAIFVKSVIKYSMTVKTWSNRSNTLQYWSSSIHDSIDHLLYCMSTLWSAWPSHSGPEDIRCCYSYRTVHCDTSEAAQGFETNSYALQDQLKL